MLLWWSHFIDHAPSFILFDSWLSFLCFIIFILDLLHAVVAYFFKQNIDHAFSMFAVSLPEHKTLLQLLVRLATFMKEQIKKWSLESSKPLLNLDRSRTWFLPHLHYNTLLNFLSQLLSYSVFLTLAQKDPYLTNWNSSPFLC